MGRDEMVDFIYTLLDMGTQTRAHATHAALHHRAWRGLTTAPGRWSRPWSARAVAAAEHLCLGLMDETDSLVRLMQVCACIEGQQ